jgi:putative methionine-R-sulfoxide reductase with GAF domain
MAHAADDLLNTIRGIVTSAAPRETRAGQFAESIKSFGQYRWVGVYDVGAELVSIIAWSGPGAPAYPTFPIADGLTGSAIAQRATVVVGDVRKDRRYLTAFGSTLSEIIVPVIHPQRGAVIGTIDVESERTNAFSDEDRQMLEKCAVAALPLWDKQR